MEAYPLLLSVLETPLPLPISPLLSLRSTPTAGRSLFALSPIPPSTLIHTSSAPFALTVVESYKREVCWTCFAVVQRGRWKVRELLLESGKGKDADGGEAVRWFCTSECWEQWKELVGEVGREAVRAGEDVISRAAKAGRTDVVPGEEEKEEDIQPSTTKEISIAWEDALVWGDETVRRRTMATTSTARPRTSQDVLLSSDDPDVYRFLISGITSRFHALDTPCLSPSSSTPLSPNAWTSLTSLVPSLATNPRALLSTIRMYKSLLSILPPPLLPYTTPLTILALLSRDNGNSFGIWSNFDGQGEERGELLAYGLYPSSSYFNHSCRPNLVKRRKGEEFEFWSGKEGVGEGDEVCISYLGGAEEGGREERRNKLMVGWGFWCECVKCREEKTDADDP